MIESKQVNHLYVICPNCSWHFARVKSVNESNIYYCWCGNCGHVFNTTNVYY